RLWLTEDCRASLLSHLDRTTLADFRLACHDFSARAAPYLFDEITAKFQSSTFARPARLGALERIGQHVKTFTFSMPHTAEMLLPPLINPVTGQQQDFVYTPQVHKPATLIGKVKEPKYGSWEMTDMLIRQYPPLFHAATNIPSFIRALEHIPNLEHLKISCPDADLAQRYRRSIVDYALISLRIAVERAPLHYLESVSLVNIHPSGLLYLQPLHGFGSTPGTLRRWSQIRKLIIRMDTFPPELNDTHTEHLKLLHSYLRSFARQLTDLAFHWNGNKGPNPLSLETEPCFANKKMAAHPPPTSSTFLQPLNFPALTNLTLQNIVTSSNSISSFLSRHKHTLADLSLDDINLATGTWDDALEPLTR
ncbi:hypothetical protein NA57DRAFT_19795, partial [Rhizodiscina lignyota]